MGRILLPCGAREQKLLYPPSAASGAAQPPRPQGAGFRRKREPRGAWARQNLVRALCVKRECFTNWLFLRSDTERNGSMQKVSADYTPAETRYAFICLHSYRYVRTHVPEAR